MAEYKLEIPTLVSDGPRAMHDSKSGVRPGLLPLVSSSQADELTGGHTRHPSDTLDRVAILTFVGGISDRSLELTGSVHPAVGGVQCYRAISARIRYPYSPSDKHCQRAMNLKKERVLSHFVIAPVICRFCDERYKRAALSRSASLRKSTSEREKSACVRAQKKAVKYRPDSAVNSVQPALRFHLFPFPLPPRLVPPDFMPSAAAFHEYFRRSYGKFHLSAASSQRHEFQARKHKL